MNKVAISILLLLSLTACDAVNTVKEGFNHSQAVANSLEKSVGMKPFVGFNWNNGVLTSVSVNFEGIPKDKPVAEIAELAQAAIKEHFKQAPKQIMLGFSIKPQ